MNLREYGHYYITVATFVVGMAIMLPLDPTLHLAHGLYSAMWSNIWAPSAWTLLGFVVADLRNARRHSNQKIHHVDTIEGLAGQIEALSDRLVLLMTGGTTDDDTIQ